MGFSWSEIVTFTKNDLFTGFLPVIIFLILLILTTIHFAGLKGKYVLTDQGIYIRKKFFPWQECCYFRNDRFYYFGLYKLIFKQRTCLLVSSNAPRPFYALGKELWVDNQNLGQITDILSRFAERLG